MQWSHESYRMCARGKRLDDASTILNRRIDARHNRFVTTINELDRFDYVNFVVRIREQRPLQQTENELTKQIKKRGSQEFANYQFVSFAPTKQRKHKRKKRTKRRHPSSQINCFLQPIVNEVSRMKCLEWPNSVGV